MSSEIIKEAKTGNPEAMSTMWEEYRKLLYKLSIRYLPVLKRHGFEVEDVEQMCYLALYNAVQSYDENSGYGADVLL